MRFAAAALTLSLAVLPAAADTVTVEASRDATLIEHPDGSLANGAGPVFTAGRTAQEAGSVRRALLRFDVAAALPERALIEEVVLTLFLNPSNLEPRTIRVHPVLADWGEGPSATSGGSGVPAGPGDATWLHTFHDTDFWVHNGGQFAGRESAAQEVIASGFYSWGGAGRLAQDVRLWQAAPGRNFGWILIGDETTPQTAKSFASREHPDPALRPALRITYRVAGDPPGR